MSVTVSTRDTTNDLQQSTTRNLRQFAAICGNLLRTSCSSFLRATYGNLPQSGAIYYVRAAAVYYAQLTAICRNLAQYTMHDPRQSATNNPFLSPDLVRTSLSARPFPIYTRTLSLTSRSLHNVFELSLDIVLSYQSTLTLELLTPLQVASS